MYGSVALYLRVSTPEQNLDAQERDLRDYAEAHGWVVVAVYREKVPATGKVEREEYDRLCKDAEDAARPWSMVLVWSLDRWSRAERFTEALDSIWALEAHGIRFLSYMEPGLNTPEDGKDDLGRDVLRALLPLMASYESKRISERVRVAMREVREGRRKTRSGNPVGRPVKVTLEKLRQVRELRAEAVPWASVATRTGLRKETARRALFNLQRGRWAVVNGPAGETLDRHPSPASGAQGKP